MVYYDIGEGLLKFFGGYATATWISFTNLSQISFTALLEERWFQLLLAFASCLTVMQLLSAARGGRLVDTNWELHDKSWYPSKARELIITGYQRWSDGLFSFYFMQNIVSIVKEYEIYDILHIGAGTGWDVKLAHPRFVALLPNNVHHIISDLNPHVEKWKELFGNDEDCPYISSPVDACSVTLDRPYLLVMKLMTHHLPRNVVKAFIANAIRNNSPVLMFDLMLPGPVMLIFVWLYQLAALPIRLVHSLINNLRSSRSLYQAALTFLQFLCFLPLLCVTMVLDPGLSFFHSFTLLDFRSILAELDMDHANCLEFYPVEWGLMYICIIKPKSLPKKETSHVQALI